MWGYEVFCAICTNALGKKDPKKNNRQLINARLPFMGKSVGAGFCCFYPVTGGIIICGIGRMNRTVLVDNRRRNISANKGT
jgi:hypothetical protein